MQPVNFLGHTIGSMSNGKSVVFKDNVNIGQFKNESDAKMWILCLNITLARIQEVRESHTKICNEYPHSPEPLVPVIVATEISPNQFIMDGDQIHLGVQFWPKNLALAPTNRPMANGDGSFAWGVMPLR